MFNSFSCTKAITATAIHLLVQDGLIASYDDLVGKYWSKFGEKHPDLTISELLSHRARMPHAMPKNVTFEQFCDFAYMCDAMCDIPSEDKSGEELKDSTVPFSTKVASNELSLMKPNSLPQNFFISSTTP